MQPVNTAPGADARLDIGDDATDAGGQQQAQVAGIGKEEGHRRPRQQCLVRWRDVEDLAEHRDVEHEAGKGDQRGKLGEIAGGVAPLQPYRQPEAGKGTGNQDGDLGGFGEVPPELVEKEEHAGRQREGPEKGGDPHAQRQLLGAVVAVNIET